MSTKLTAFHRRVSASRLLKKQVELLAAKCWRRSGGETRAQTATRIGRQRELRDQQQAALDVAETAIHTATIIFKEAISQQELKHPPTLRLAIPGLHANQREYTALDEPGAALIDIHPGMGNALDQRDQVILQSNCKALRMVAWSSSLTLHA